MVILLQLLERIAWFLSMTNQKQGIINAIIAYTMWGVYPLYWWLLQSVGPTELLINRMIWSFVTLLIVIISLRRFRSLKLTVSAVLANKKKFALLIAATITLGMNWFIFTFAVTTDRILEASLGYYINPIISILIGVVLLKEKLNRYQVIAVFLASVGVLFLTVTYDAFPWISLILAFSFGFYGLAKKLIQIDSFFSLILETTLMLPISAFFFTAWLVDGTSTFLQPNTTYILLLMGAGFITMSPLYFFAKAASALPLKTLGFLQYIGPSLQMVVAIFITGEDFSPYRLLTFGFIWVACLLFSTSHLLPIKQVAP